jgi:hypothetical protein
MIIGKYNDEDVIDYFYLARFGNRYIKSTVAATRDECWQNLVKLHDWDKFYDITRKENKHILSENGWEIVGIAVAVININNIEFKNQKKAEKNDITRQ